MTENNVPYRPGMTLMPGQSTTVSVSIPGEIGAQMSEGFRFVEAPPPTTAPVQDIAETLGLCAGLRAKKSHHGQWRCSACLRMQTHDSWQVWVPDGVQKGDPAWSVTETARRNAYNGHSSAWCMSCAPKAPKQYLQNQFALLPPLSPKTATATNYFPLAFAVAMGAAALMGLMATLPR